MGKMMKKILLALCASSLLLLSGCGPLPIKMSDYSAARLQPTDPLPKITEGNSKVVIFKPDVSGVKLAKQAKVGHSIATALEQYISVTGSEIVDREIAQKLKQEIQLAEMKGKSEYQGPNVADFAITGTIASANAGAKFSEASQWTDKNGEIHVTSAKCKYTAQVKANLRVYKLPALSFLKTISIDDSVSVTEDTRGSQCPQSQSSKEALVQQAASKAVKDARDEFQNFFAPKAYVLERRSSESGSIFKLSQGETAGFTYKSDVTFYHLENSRNPLTGKTSSEEYEITTGIVSNLMGGNHAWVLVEDTEKANHIKLGDYVKVVYEKCSWCDFIEGATVLATDAAGDYLATDGAGSSSEAVPQTNFSGLWEGTGTQYDSNSSWSIRLTAVGGEYSIEYPSLGCGGTLTLLSNGPSKLELNESLSYGASRCVNNGKIVLEKTHENSVKFRWFYSNGREGASGTLVRN